MDFDEISDAELIDFYVKGDSSAFAALESRYRKQLFAWLVSSLSNRSDAEDLYQDIWMKIIKKADSFKNVSFKAWMWKIARNRVIDFRRKKQPDLTLDTSFNEDAQPFVERLKSKETGPAKRFEIDEMTQKVFFIVGQLPDNQREVFLLRMESHLSFNEIATSLDIPLNTALGRMHDAIKKVKKKLLEVM
ncbi:MAG: sigma-70 family RNA polymerase sigma factor [Kiritimatiellae bacterium]|jgi:RNA polymerase sigma-70 factor (ECF subfamily)|nr:sigma-70 family RNA polymerase sigma factor [Kiritimatiellia bacterium]